MENLQKGWKGLQEKTTKGWQIGSLRVERTPFKTPNSRQSFWKASRATICTSYDPIRLPTTSTSATRNSGISILEAVRPILLAFLMILCQAFKNFIYRWNKLRIILQVDCVPYIYFHNNYVDKNWQYCKLNCLKVPALVLVAAKFLVIYKLYIKKYN